jgi:hypothetical protein
MKQTPREALLARHADAVPELDALRLAVLPQPPLGAVEFLRELFLPARHAWVALALVWLLLAAFQFSSRNAPANPSPAGTLPQRFALCSTSNAQLDALLSETRALR